MATHLPNYPEFTVLDDGTIATRWADWLEGFQAMIRAMKITDNADKRAMLMHYVGTDVRKLFTTTTLEMMTITKTHTRH